MNAARLDIDFAKHVRPTADMLWSRIRKDRILDVARQTLGTAWASARSKYKKADLATAMEEAFAAGAPALLIASDAPGRFEQLVVNTPGLAELWALTTSPADVALRSRLQARLAPVVARAVLARAFPTGTARARIDAELGRLAAAGIRADATEEDVLDRLAEELVLAAETTQSAFGTAGDDPATAGSTGRSVPASQPTETEE